MLQQYISFCPVLSIPTKWHITEKNGKTNTHSSGTTIQGKCDLSEVATECGLLGWHSMSLGKLFLIIVHPISGVKMTVPQSFEIVGTTFNSVTSQQT
jgi:hypothetical protein